MRITAAAAIVFLTATAAAAQLAPARPIPAQPPEGTASIHGRVIAAETGDAVRRADVRITLSSAAGMPSLQQSAITDAEGRYEFLKLPAGRYTVTASRRGYVTLQFGQRQPFEAGKSLDVAANEAAADIDFALPRGGVIAGRIIDDMGEPVAGAMIQVERATFGPTGRTRTSVGAQPVYTDDLGQFRFYGLMPASYFVTATPPRDMYGFNDQTTPPQGQIPAQDTEGFVRTYFPGTVNPDEAQPVPVGLGEDSQASFELISTRLARVTGVIRTTDGKPPQPSFISAQLTTGSGNANTFFQNVAPDGAFALSNLAPGDYMLTVIPQGRFRNGPPSAADAADPEFAMMPLSVAGRDITGLTVTTMRGGTITGHVTFDGTAAKPSTPLYVAVTPVDRFAGGTFSAPMTDNGRVDATGHFAIRGVAGKVLFRISSSSWNVTAATYNGQDLLDTPIDIKPGTALSGVEIVLSDRQSKLDGKVTDADGRPVRDYTVLVLPARAREGLAAARYTRVVRPDQNGRFEIRGLPASDYVAVAVDSVEQGAEWDPGLLQRLRQAGKPFTLSLGQELTLDLPLSR